MGACDYHARQGEAQGQLSYHHTTPSHQRRGFLLEYAMTNLDVTDTTRLDAIITALLQDVMSSVRSGYASVDIQAGIMIHFEQAGHRVCSLMQPYLARR